MSPTFSYSQLLPLGKDETKYRLVSKEGVKVVKLGDRAVSRSFTRGAHKANG